MSKIKFICSSANTCPSTICVHRQAHEHSGSCENNCTVGTERKAAACDLISGRTFHIGFDPSFQLLIEKYNEGKEEGERAMTADYNELADEYDQLREEIQTIRAAKTSWRSFNNGVDHGKTIVQRVLEDNIARLTRERDFARKECDEQRSAKVSANLQRADAVISRDRVKKEFDDFREEVNGVKFNYLIQSTLSEVLSKDEVYNRLVRPGQHFYGVDLAKHEHAVEQAAKNAVQRKVNDAYKRGVKIGYKDATEDILIFLNKGEKK